MWENFQNLIPKAAGKYGFTRTLKAIEVCQQFRTLSKNILPEKALQNADAKSFEEGTLTVEVYDSGWAQQIQMNKHRIIEAINQKYGHDLIKNLKIKMVERPQPLSEI